MNKLTYKSKPKEWREEEWREALNIAVGNLSEGNADGFRIFLDTYAKKLSYKKLIKARDALVPKVRDKTSCVLRGAALKAHALKIQGLFKKLHKIISEKQEHRRARMHQRNGQSVMNEKEAKGPPEQFTADELLEQIESADSFKALENVFEILLLSGRVEEWRKRRYRATNKGQSGLKDINHAVNQELLKAYRLKNQELKEQEKRRKKLEAKEEAKRAIETVRWEERKNERALEKARKEITMPGIFEEVKIGGSKIRLYIGYSKKGKKIVRVDRVISGKPDLTEGSTYEIHEKSHPDILKGLLSFSDFRSKFAEIDAKIAEEKKSKAA